MASSGLELLWVSLPQLGKGAAQTLSISLLSIAFSTVGGVLYGVLRTMNNRLVNAVLRVYLELSGRFRCWCGCICCSLACRSSLA